MLASLAATAALAAAQAPQLELLVAPSHRAPPSASGAGGGGALRSLHEAAAAAEALQRGHPDAAVTVRLLPGVHTLDGHPLIPGHRQRWVGEPRPGGEPSVVSGGASVTGWVPAPSDAVPLPPAGNRTRRWVAQLPRGARPKTLRVGAARAPQVTWPGAHLPAARQFLFARTVVPVNGSGGPAQVNVGIDEEALPAGWEAWTSLVAYTYPANSWVGMRVMAVPNPRATPNGEARFLFTCADGFSGLKPGNRIVFAGPPSLLGVGGASGVWAADEAAGRVYYLSEQVPEDVWVPIQSRLVTVEGRSNVSFESVTFVDVDFSASGVQTGFNDRLSDAGCPHDASVAISNSRDVSIQGCAFTAVGGCGVLVGNLSSRVEVTDSQFSEIGQSGVMFVGNDTTQARECSVRNNSMRSMGSILASAAGVLITSASNITVSSNNISDCARWGVAVRTNAEAHSFNNTIALNRIVRTGLRTADFGAISFIDHSTGHNTTGNRIIGNCVRETRGMRDRMWRGEFGQIYSAFWGRALYLDDHTSFTEISGNIFVDTSANAIFFHSGNNNTARNNVFVNSTVLAEQTGAQLLFKEITHGTIEPQFGNVLERNVIWSPRAADEEGDEVPMFSGRPASLAAADGNLYFRRGIPMAGSSLFFNKSWRMWQASGFDKRSLLNTDPGFVNAEAGDFNLRGDSPLPALGFEPLPMPLCPREL